MSNRIYKYRKKSSEVAAFYRNFLLHALSSSHSLIILSCYNCAIQGIPLYRVSIFDSGRYKIYIFANRMDCNMLKVIKKN